MFIPLGDEPNPRGIPFVTYAIILANVAVYAFITLPLSFTAANLDDPALREYLRAVSPLLPDGVSWTEVLRSLSAYDLFTFTWGYRPVDPHELTLITAMFLHGGFMHLAGNMLFLWIYGDNVEHRLGPFPVVGASGAISGVLGFYFVWFPHNRVRLWVFLFPFFANVLLVPARIVLGLYLIIENMLPYLATRGIEGAGVAYGAHIGGFAAGLAVAWGMNRREVRKRPPGFRVAGEPAEVAAAPASPGEAIAEALDGGRMDEAAARYFSLAPDQVRRALSPDHSLALANWLRANGHARAAVVVYQRHLRDYPLGDGAAGAHAGLGLVQLHALDQPTSAYQHFVDALGLDPSPETEAIVRQALDEIKGRQKFRVGRNRR
jgi:membrane associated rhomboid family serine protease